MQCRALGATLTNFRGLRLDSYHGDRAIPQLMKPCCVPTHLMWKKELKEVDQMIGIWMATESHRA